MLFKPIFSRRDGVTPPPGNVTEPGKKVILILEMALKLKLPTYAYGFVCPGAYGVQFSNGTGNVFSSQASFGISMSGVLRAIFPLVSVNVMLYVLDDVKMLLLPLNKPLGPGQRVLVHKCMPVFLLKIKLQ